MVGVKLIPDFHKISWFQLRACVPQARDITAVKIEASGSVIGLVEPKAGITDGPCCRVEDGGWGRSGLIVLLGREVWILFLP